MTRTRFSDQMRTAVSDEWARAHVDHPTVKGIGDGTLSMDRFRYYMSQDYLFLIEYCRVIALAAAKSPDLESMSRWASLLDETLNSEMELHRSFCADFGITPPELEATLASPTTLAYTGHLLDVARSGTIEEIAAAMLPCQWGYDDIGRVLAERDQAPKGSLHRRWIDGYNSREYQAVTEWLRNFTDQLASESSDATRARMQLHFSESTRHEYAFWEAAWSLEPA